MGFEKLAALKEQLAKQAKQQRQEKQEQQPKPAQPKPRQGQPKPKQAKAGSQPAAPRQRKPHADKPQADKPSKPVDPVVHSIAKLQKRFPKAFPKNPAPKVPLKIGTFEDLRQHAATLGLTEAELREAIRTWCSGARYWSCMVEGAKRLDLEGQEAGVVSQADAKRAQYLKARRATGARAAAQARQTKEAGQAGQAAQATGATETTETTEAAQATEATQATQATQATEATQSPS